MKDNLLPQLLADLRERAALTPEHADHVLHMRSISALEHVASPAVDPFAKLDAMAKGALVRRPRDTPEFLREKFVALRGLGPEFRLRMGAKEVACPKCNQTTGKTCFNGRVCDERVFAFAAYRRRCNAHPGAFLEAKHGLTTAPKNPDAINRAIDLGLLRLTRAEDGSPQWVDA